MATRLLLAVLASGLAGGCSGVTTVSELPATVTVDFNPVADRLRVIGSDGTNLRANVADGKVVTDGALKLNGKLSIKRSEYGMDKLLEGVKDDVDINVSVGEPTQLPKAE